MRIRRVTTGDIERLRDIDAASFAADDQYDPAFYVEAVSSDRFHATAMLEDDVIAAWALVDTASAPVRIRSLSVHPHFRRRGYAAALICDIAARHDEAIDLLVAPENAAAIALYERMGFRLAEPDPEMPQRLRLRLDRRRAAFAVDCDENELADR